MRDGRRQERRPCAALTGARAEDLWTAAAARGRADAGGAMRIIIAVAVVSLAAVTAICCWSRAESAATELTDADAARIVRDLLNQQSHETVLLGNIVVYTTTAPIPPGNNITSSQYSRYKMWQSIGLIDIVTNSGSLPGPLPWADWQSPIGKILERIIVTPTSKAANYGFYRGTTLTITMTIFKVDNLIKNEERVIGVYTYRILMGTYVSSWTPVFLNFCRADNACASAEKGKFIVLVKLNDFTQRWNIVAWDVADFNHQFTTRNVDQQLLSLR